MPIAEPAGIAQPNGNGALFGNLACVDASDCWTAGTGIDKAGGDVPFIEHWDGHAFKLVATPVSKSFLQGVACASSTDCWAAGGAGTPTNVQGGRVGHFVPLLGHYNGSKWSAVYPPNPGSSPDDELSDVSCTTAKDCYAVGWTRTAQSERTLIEFWNGKRWQTASHAALAGQTFSAMVGIECPSKCIAVGTEQATSSHPPHVVGEVQAAHRVRIKHSHKYRTVLQWESVRMPSPRAPNDYTQVTGISCPALDDCLATGSAYYWPDQGLDPGEAIAWHWNGRRWSLIMPHLAGPRSGGGVSQLTGIACSGRASCWAVGSTFTDMQKAPAVTASWNGTKFSESSNDNPYESDHLDAVGCAKDHSCVSVGWGANGGGSVHPFALKLQGS
ncbi:MAG: hypothetical protein ACYC91_13200 [Solirubrobacteraceae bacterium]